MSDEEIVLHLRDKGYMISNIAYVTGYSVTFICDIIDKANKEDKEND